MTIIYLACPYSRGDAEVRLARFNAVTTVAARLIEKSMIIFSPITMTHPIDLVLSDDNETMGSQYWVEFDTQFMGVCSSLSVLTLPGWDTSSGVAREIEYFGRKGVSPNYLTPEDYGVNPRIALFRAAFM